jgi:hypothetical protein
MNTIDGLTYEEVKYNVYAFGKDMKVFARKRDRARTEHMKAKWQRKFANAKGYLENNQERLARFEAFQQLRAVDERNASALEVNPETELVAPVEVALAAHH